MSKDINQDIIPPIFKWAESLSTNLTTLQEEIKHDAEKLEEFHRQHKHENSIKSPLPTSPRSTKTIKSSRATLLSPLSNVRSPSSIHSARNKDNNHQIVISFEPTANTIENVNKMFNDLPESIHYTANKVTSDGERIMADVAKKIWGNDVPKTFLTALDIEIPFEEEEDFDDYYSSSAYMTYSSKDPSKLSTKRRSITLPALEVQKEKIPKDLKDYNLGFPNKTDPDIMIRDIIETTEFESTAQQNAFEKITLCNYSLDIISDGFWWFLMNEWKENKEQIKDTQQIVFNRMCKNYVNLFLSAPQKYKDAIFDNYHDVLSQSIFTCFLRQYPKSKTMFTNEIKLKILHITSKWTMGCIPASLSFKHWNVPIKSHQKNKSNQSDQENEQICSNLKMIPTQITRKDVVFEHSEFVRYYLKHEAKIQIGEKTKIRLNMTFCKTPTQKVPFQQLNEECVQRSNETEKARMNLMVAQKELSKMVRKDNAVQKEYTNELQQQLFVAKKNKKQFVKNIVKELSM